MRSASAPAFPPPPVGTDSRLVEPDEQWKADLRRRIEHSLRHMVENAQTVRDTILNSQPSEIRREHAQREYDESMSAIRMLAQEEFNRELRIEISERKWALDVVDSSCDTGLHRARSLNSDQHRSSSVAPHNPHIDTELPPTQARDRMASTIGSHERQMSASASLHDRPSLPIYPTVVPQAIPGARPPPLDDAIRFPTSASPGSRTLFRRLPPIDGDISDASDDVGGHLDDR